MAANSQIISQARQNALMGLNIAIGQLQKYSGPDQRVTARSEILDTDPLDRDSDGQPVIDETELPNRYWTGVWDSSKWHPLTGIYDGLGIRGRQRPAPMVWLVSGNEEVGDKYDPTAALPLEKQVLFSGVDAAGNADMQHPRVEVPRVEVTAPSVPGLPGSPVVGHYAYWVGDEGVKAKINTVADASVADASSGAGQYWRAMNPTRSGGELIKTAGAVAFPEFKGTLDLTSQGERDRELLRRSLSSSQLAFIEDASASRVFPEDGLRRHAFDLSLASKGVLADTVRGGLRLDFTRYLETGATDGAFVAGDSIYKDAGLAGGRQPSYALLKSWYDIGRNFNGMNPTASIQSERTTGNTITQMGLFPVITRFHLVYAAMGDGPGAPLKVVMHPSVTLWNPHNVTLNAEDLVLEIEQDLRMQVQVRLHGAGTQYASGYVYMLSRMDGPLRLRLQGLSLAPGETVVYSLDAPGGGAATWSTAPSGLLPPSFPVMVPRYYDRNFVSVDSSLVLDSTPVPPGDWLEYDMSSAPLNGWFFKAKLFRESEYASGIMLQDIEDPTGQGFGGGTFYPFDASIPNDNNVFKGDSATMAMPASESHLANGTTRFMTSVPYANFNLRGAFGRLTSFEGPRGALEGDPFFTWVRLSTLPYVSFEPGSTVDLAYTGASTTLTGPVNSQLGNYAIMFDYPNTNWATSSGAPAMVSLGAFQHADLSSFNLQPTYVFGNSLPDPRIKRENIAGRIPDNPATDASQVANGVNDVYLRDTSYLANNALWDRFFLSTIPQTGSVGFDGKLVLANSRMQPIPDTQPGVSDYPDIVDVREVKKAAGSLLLDGAFNINSTSVEAWRAFLGGLADMVVPDAGWSQNGFPAGTTSDPVAEGLRHNYSRFLLPRSHAFDQSNFNATTTDGAVNAAAWTGHRYLTDAEIDTLARNMVEEVKVRGPFMSIADFVNRRLITASADEANNVTADITKHRLKVGASGALHRAILNLTDITKGLNASLNEPVMGSARFTYGSKTASAYEISGTGSWRGLSSLPSQLELMNGGLVGQLSFGAPAFLTQADVLQKIGGAISARSDTFVVRSYGDVRDPVTDTVKGRAWCEAVVQRMPDYVDSSAAQPPEAGSSAAGSASLNTINQQFGRRYKVVSFRWLGENDI